jgi:hypothetical protein
MTNLNPRVRRIPPRAESLVRYINDVMVWNLRVGSDEDIVLNLPAVVSLAYMVTYETGTIPVQEFDTNVMFVPAQ